MAYFFPRSIAGRRAIVTGASSGIGREIALELARQQVRQVVTARRQDRLESLVAEIAALGGEARWVAGDVTDPDVRDRTLAAAREAFGGLDLLVNNAGIARYGQFSAADSKRLRLITEVNYFSLVEMTRLCLPALRDGQKPLIANISSILGHIGLPGLSEYSASKFAVRGFSEALRAELFDDGIHVLVVSPATTETEIWETMASGEGATGEKETPWRARRGVTAAFVARQTVRAIRRRQREIFPGLPAKSLHLFNRLAPQLVAFGLERRH